MIPAVVLAAGASTRLGEPKQLVQLADETLLERAVRTAREAGCTPVVVVLGASHVEVLARSRLGDAVTLINDEWREGMASSIRLGVRTLQFVAKDAEGVLLMTCDQPAVTPEHLKLVMTRQEVKGSRYVGRNGVPAYFPKRYFGELAELTGDAGARDLLSRSPAIDLVRGELDIDTAEDLALAREVFG
jgi:molybdenum cofactor cytidylyltransferase